MKMKQYDEYYTLEERWNDVVYNLIDYPSIQMVLQSLNQNFIQDLPLLDEKFISNILNNIS